MSFLLHRISRFMVHRDKSLFAKRGLAVETAISKAQPDALAVGRTNIAQFAADKAVAIEEAAKKDLIILADAGNGMLNLFVRPEPKSLAAIVAKHVKVALIIAEQSFEGAVGPRGGLDKDAR
jgi:hypothetical protein